MTARVSSFLKEAGTLLRASSATVQERGGGVVGDGRGRFVMIESLVKIVQSLGIFVNNPCVPSLKEFKPGTDLKR